MPRDATDDQEYPNIFVERDCDIFLLGQMTTNISRLRGISTDFNGTVTISIANINPNQNADHTSMIIIATGACLMLVAVI